MDEIHEREQYFWDGNTLSGIERVVEAHTSDDSSPPDRLDLDPCFLCTPTLARQWTRGGKSATLLDVDRRFSDVPGFCYFDLSHPESVWNSLRRRRFSIVVCDPPFFNLSLSQLRNAIRAISQYEPQQPLLISYLLRRENAFLEAFREFQLAPTGITPHYPSLTPGPKNDIRFYGNLSPVCYTAYAQD